MNGPLPPADRDAEVPSLDPQAIIAGLPPALLAALEAQDEDAYQRALAQLSAADRDFYTGQLARLQAYQDALAQGQTNQSRAAQNALLASLPIELRLAVLDQDEARLKIALQDLPAGQAATLLEGLEAAGLLDWRPASGGDNFAMEFGPMIQAIAAVALGNEAARPPVQDFLVNLEAERIYLSGTVERIWAGERDPGALCRDLDALECQVIEAVLACLA